MILYNFFHDFIQVYSPGARADNPLGVQFWCQQEHLVTSVICCKFQKISLKFDFIHLFLWFIHAQYIVTGLGQTAPMGQSFDVNRNVLLLHSFVASFKKLSLKSDFIQTFLWLNTCIQPRGTADRPQGIKFWWQQKGFIILPNCSKFQTNLFEVWFHTIFFHDLILYIAPGQGQTATRGQNFDVSRN